MIGQRVIGGLAIVFGVSAVVWVGGWGGVVHAQPLDRELSRLLAAHPEIQEARDEADAARAAVGEARAGYLPRVTVNGDIGYGETDTPSRRRAGQDALESEQTSARIEAVQPVFDGFEAAGSTGEARSLFTVAELQAAATEQSVMFDGIEAYLDVLRHRARLDLANQNEENIMSQLRLEDARVAKGSGIKLDVLFSKARLQLAIERRVRINGDLMNAMNAYRRAFKAEPDLAAMAVPNPPVAELPLTKAEAITIAQDDNLQLLGSMEDAEAASQARRSARSDYYPHVDLAASAGYEDNIDGVEGIRRDWVVQMRVRWKLFDGLLTPSRAARADARHSAALSRSASLSREVEETTSRAWDDLMTARERFKLLDNAVAIAEEVFESRKRLRDLGKETAINVLDAESELFNARSNLVEAEYDVRLASYQLLLAMGRLTPRVLGVEAAG